MRKLALQMGVSLDGMVARRGGFGSGGWGVPPEDPALKARKISWTRDADLHLHGARFDTNKRERGNLAVHSAP